MIIIDRQARFEFIAALDVAQRSGQLPETNAPEANIARYCELMAPYSVAIKSGDTVTAADIGAEARSLNAAGAS